MLRDVPSENVVPECTLETVTGVQNYCIRVLSLQLLYHRVQSRKPTYTIWLFRYTFRRSGTGLLESVKHKTMEFFSFALRNLIAGLRIQFKQMYKIMEEKGFAQKFNERPSIEEWKMKTWSNTIKFTLGAIIVIS